MRALVILSVLALSGCACGSSAPRSWQFCFIGFAEAPVGAELPAEWSRDPWARIGPR